MGFFPLKLVHNTIFSLLPVKLFLSSREKSRKQFFVRNVFFMLLSNREGDFVFRIPPHKSEPHLWYHAGQLSCRKTNKHVEKDFKYGRFQHHYILPSPLSYISVFSPPHLQVFFCENLYRLVFAVNK